MYPLCLGHPEYLATYLAMKFTNLLVALATLRISSLAMHAVSIGNSYS